MHVLTCMHVRFIVSEFTGVVVVSVSGIQPLRVQPSYTESASKVEKAKAIISSASSYASKPCRCKSKCGHHSCGCKRGNFACSEGCGCRCEDCLNPASYPDTEDGIAKLQEAERKRDERNAVVLKQKLEAANKAKAAAIAAQLE